MEFKLLDLDDDAETRGYADVRIAAQAVDRPGEPASSHAQIIESLRETSPDWHDTVVAPLHRGRGLARFVKAHMLRWLLADKPELACIDTGTASADSPMIRVNEALGFVTTREVVVVSRSV